MEILYEDKDIIVLNKPVGVPSEKTQTADGIIEIIKKELNEDAFLVHRLDTNTGGVMIFAKNKKSAAYLSSEIQNGGLQKEYLFVTDGIPEEKSGVLEDYLFKDSRKNRSFVVKSMRKGVKKASLSYEVIGEKENKALIKALLHTGRSHQIRVQFSFRKLPLCGDGKYGSHDNKAQSTALFSHKISLKLSNGENKTFFDFPDIKKYPWNLFEDELNGQSIS